MADGGEPLRAVRCHPNRIASGDGIVAFLQAVDALSGKHEQAVFHDVGLDKGQRRAGLISKKVHRQIIARIDGEQRLQKRAGIAEEGLGGDGGNEAVDERGGFEVGVGFEDFAENGDARGFVAKDGDRRL